MSLRVAIVGAGWVAQDRYLPVLARCRDVSLVGVADHNLQRAEDVAARFSTEAFEDADQLLARSPNAVFICTSPFSHRSIAESAIAAGAHVFVEKPMAVEVADAERMATLANENKLVLGVAHNLLFCRSVRAALSRVRSGRLGDIQGVLAFQSSSPRRRLPSWYSQLPGGLFYDEAPHMLYLLDAFVGPLRIDGSWANSTATGEYSAFGADFVGEGDVRVTLRMLFESPVSEWLLTLVLEGGVIVIDLFRDTSIFLPAESSHKPLDVLTTSIRAFVGHGWGTIHTGVRYISRRQFWGHDLVIRDFLRAVGEDAQPAVTSADGLRITRLIHDLLAESRPESPRQGF